jgi:hypothetical protein
VSRATLLVAIVAAAGACPGAARALLADDALQPREIAPSVFVLAFEDRLGSANAGWVALPDEVVLVGAPRAAMVERILGAVRRTSPRPPRRALRLHAGADEPEAVKLLADRGIEVAACVHGPRIDLSGRNTVVWIRALRRLRTLEHPEFRKLLRNAMRWCLKLER